jgi:hypothetical protein
MPATVTTLEREIVREERYVGLPTDQPLTDRALARRRIQIAALLSACGFVALFAVFAAIGVVQVCAIALAGSFGVYAMEQDHHLRRLGVLRGDVRRISLVVADELMYTGALSSDRALLDLRDNVARSAGALAAALADILPADSARVRLVGPSGEVPVAAERGARFADDPALASEAIRMAAPVRRPAADRTLLVVPMWRGTDPVAALEVISPRGAHYQPGDAAVVDAFARGAVAALNSLPTVWSSRGATR